MHLDGVLLGQSLSKSSFEQDQPAAPGTPVCSQCILACA